MVPSPRPAWIPFGTLARAHGVRGEMRLVPFDLQTSLPDGTERVRVRPRQGAPVSMTLRRIRPVHRALLVTMAEIPDREVAQAWAGAVLEIDSSSLPPLEPGELYLFELVGADAVDAGGRPIGVVRELLDNRGQDILVLDAPQGERMLPVIGDTIVEFRREERLAVVRVPPGLWDE